MTTGHLVLTANSPELLDEALSHTLYGATGDVIFDPLSQQHCPGPSHPNMLSLIVRTNACAEAICNSCDATLCASCHTAYVLCLDTGKTLCERCAGRTIWQFLADLAAESEPRKFTVVYGCFSCGGEEDPERSATMIYTKDDGSRAIHWLCRPCVQHHGPERALSQLTEAEMHPSAQPVFNGSSPTRQVSRINQGPDRSRHANPRVPEGYYPRTSQSGENRPCPAQHPPDRPSRDGSPSTTWTP